MNPTDLEKNIKKFNKKYTIDHSIIIRAKLTTNSSRINPEYAFYSVLGNSQESKTKAFIIYNDLKKIHGAANVKIYELNKEKTHHVLNN